MLSGGEDDLICDFAETYHVLDWRALPVSLSATLAAGLPEGSRCIRRANESAAPPDTLLLAAILDRLQLWLWMNADPRRRGSEPPDSVMARLTGKATGREPERLRSFSSGAEFDAAWKAATETR